jgi:hypothetical protein
VGDESEAPPAARPAAEAELDAPAPQASREGSGAGSASGMGTQAPTEIASDAHDDAGISPGGAFDPNLGRSGTGSRKPASASAQGAARDVHAAASDDCACS